MNAITNHGEGRKVDRDNYHPCVDGIISFIHAGGCMYRGMCTGK